MLRFFIPILSLLLAANSTAGSLPADTLSVSIPAWIEGTGCGATPSFQATSNGRPVPITSQLGPGTDQIILLVLDFSGDMSLVEAAKQALVAQISQLPSNAWVGLLSDQDGLHVVADPSPNHQRVADAISAMPNLDKPGLFDTVRSAVGLADTLLAGHPIRVSVLYVTDSNIYNYQEDYTNPVINQSDPHDISRRFPDALIRDKISRLEGDLSSLDAPLFVVHIHYRSDTLNESYENGLLSLAETTGGTGQLCRSLGEISDGIAAAFSRISSAWRLTLGLRPKTRNSVQIHLNVPCGGEDARLSWRVRLRVHPKEG